MNITFCGFYEFRKIVHTDETVGCKHFTSRLDMFLCDSSTHRLIWKTI